MNCSKEEMLLCFKEAAPYAEKYEELLEEHNRLFDIYKGKNITDVITEKLDERVESRKYMYIVAIVSVFATYVVGHVTFLIFDSPIIIFALTTIAFFASFIAMYMYLLKKTGKFEKKEQPQDVIKASQKAEKVREQIQSEYRSLCNICWFLEPQYCYPKMINKFRMYLEEEKAQDLEGLLRLYNEEK